MRANEFKLEEMLAEIAMNPRSLQAAVEKIPARAGMEFEMYVPGAAEEVEDFESVPDYDEDRRVQGFDDILEFFDQGSQNSRDQVSRLKRTLGNDYNKWLVEAIADDWISLARGYIYTYLRNYATKGDIAEILGIEDEDQKITGKEYEDAAIAVDEEGRGKYWYDSAREDASDNFKSDHNEDVWAEEQFHYMSDVETHYSWLAWPFWTEEPEVNPTVSIDEVADDFTRAVGRPVNAANTYYAGRREPGHYVVEPDGSLDEPDSDDDRGLEFISPPLSIAEIFSDLKKVQKWAGRTGCYTNKSTGLHINVSIEGAKVEQLDYVKLALLLGDQYVLEQFGRVGNTYCRSAMRKIQNNISALREDQLQAFMLEMKQGLNQLASRAILDPGQVTKYTSIHPKEGYIEFRSPGGDWLDLNFDKIENTALRMVVALDAAYDPQKYRKEYLKKLSKILIPDGQSDEYGDMTKQFSEYVAQGNWPKLLPGAIKLTGEQQKILKSFRTAALQSLQQSNLKRSKKIDSVSGKLYWWRVFKGTRVAEVVATSAYEAKQKAAQEWGDNWRDPAEHQMYSARPIRPYEGHGEQSLDANYEIVYRGTTPPRPVFRFIANTVGEAWRKYADWLAGNGYPEDTADYGFRPMGTQQVQGGTGTNAPTASTPTAITVSGSTYSTPSVYRWKVLINGVQVFELNAASQGEANQLARTWILQRSPEFLRAHQGGEVEVVPEFT